MIGPMAQKSLTLPLRSPLNGTADSVVAALRAVSGVSDLAVAEDRISLRFDCNIVDADRLIALVQQAGGFPAVKSARFVVTGMHCSSCAIAIERALLRLPGVVNAELTFATEKVGVVYDPRLGSPAKFRKAIESVGFGTLTEDDAAARESAQVRDLR